MATLQPSAVRSQALREEKEIAGPRALQMSAALESPGGSASVSTTSENLALTIAGVHAKTDKAAALLEAKGRGSHRLSQAPSGSDSMRTEKPDQPSAGIRGIGNRAAVLMGPKGRDFHRLTQGLLRSVTTMKENRDPMIAGVRARKSVEAARLAPRSPDLQESQGLGEVIARKDEIKDPVNDRSTSKDLEGRMTPAAPLVTRDSSVNHRAIIPGARDLNGSLLWSRGWIASENFQSPRSIKRQERQIPMD
jgi:hypothetical protein